VCLREPTQPDREVPAEQNPAVLTRRPRHRELVSVPPLSPGAGRSPTHRAPDAPDGRRDAP
jgi:hypothetical protein